MKRPLSQKERDARRELVHPKFIERWAKRFLEISRDQGKVAAIHKFNEFLNPDDARDVGQEARRLRQVNPNLNPKK